MKNSETTYNYSLEELLDELALSHESLKDILQRSWIVPAASQHFDEEDRQRLKLICELRSSFEVNDEGVDIILHLVDQLQYLHRIVRLIEKTKHEIVT